MTFVNSTHPYLACSPDGICVDKLIEVKCVWLGKWKNVNDLIADGKIKYIASGQLKEKHRYYGQIQMNLGMLGLKKAELCLFSSYDSSIRVLNVERDDAFINSLFEKLHFWYFTYYLPVIVREHLV